MRLPGVIAALFGVAALSVAAEEAVSRSSPAAASALAEADRLWEKRAVGSTGGAAAAGIMEPVIAGCRRALSDDADSLEARWRLMRALYFKGEHAVSGTEEKKKIFDEGRKVGDDALLVVRRRAARDGPPLDKATPVELAPRVKDVPGAAASFLWSAVDRGKWALVFGKSAAIKQGAAAKIRDAAQAAILLDPALEEGGGYRVLGRLHHQTPSVPFFTAWASRKEALKNLRLALEAGPRNFINRLYLAEALWDYQPAEREKARSMLKALVDDTPAPDFLVEDRKAQEEAAALLESWRR